MRDKQDLFFLEIGTFEGMAAIWMLNNVLTNPTSRLHIVDPFMYLGIGNKSIDFNQVKANFMENIKPYMDKVKIFEGTSEQRLPEIISGDMPAYDAIYIDGSHKARDVMLDAVFSWIALKPNGILIFDDYVWGGQYPMYMRPKPAIDAFLSAYQDELELLEKGSQVFVRKK